MPTLLDPVPPNVLELLRMIARGYTEAGGHWPVWQYVVRHLDDAGFDAEQLLLGLTTWRHHYRYIAAPLRAGTVPSPDMPVGLTIAGIFHAGAGHTNELMKAFVAALAEACAAQRAAEPTPTQSVSVVLHGFELTSQAIRRAGVNVAPEQLRAVLRTEPATWSGLQNEESPEWTWDITKLRLREYTAVTTGRGYLATLEGLVGHPPAVLEPAVLLPTALPEALDHLNLAWRQVTGGTPLLHVSRAMLPAVLTQPVNSVEEFESRCSALANLLDDLKSGAKANPATGVEAKRSLAGLKDQLSDLLGDEAGRAHDAVNVLRDIVRVRVGQQHRGADLSAEEARGALGLVTFGDNWAHAWEHLRAVAVRALTTIREEISDLIDS